MPGHPLTETAILQCAHAGTITPAKKDPRVQIQGAAVYTAPNNGTVAADAPGRTLDLTSQPMTNNAELWARNGGNLQVSGINLTQASNASIRSESGSRITLNGANVSGGVIQTGSDSPADAAVFAAYGWPSDLHAEQLLCRLLHLHAERAQEEQRPPTKPP